MTRPWRLVAGADTAEGRLELRQRGERDFLISIGGRVLMNGAASRSEEALARAGCADLAAPAPRVLVGGLGLGLTLRGALDLLPPAARVVVAELDPTIVDWCRGPLASLNGRALDDRRVRLEIDDVAAVIARAGDPPAGSQPAPFDAILLDLYEGPRQAAGAASDPFYGAAALARTRRALAPGGVFAVWSEDPDAAFERRLAAAGFRAERRRPGGGGPRHAVYLARVAGEPGPRARGRSGTIR